MILGWVPLLQRCGPWAWQNHLSKASTPGRMSRTSLPTADESLQQRSWSSAGEHTVPSRACEEVQGWFDELSQAVSKAVAEQEPCYPPSPSHVKDSCAVPPAAFRAGVNQGNEPLSSPPCTTIPVSFRLTPCSRECFWKHRSSEGLGAGRTQQGHFRLQWELPGNAKHSQHCCFDFFILLFWFLHPHTSSVGNTMDRHPWLCQALLPSKHLGRILHPHSHHIWNRSLNWCLNVSYKDFCLFALLL